jgi:glycosyltransferase involved in cell wall biosynthesis
MKQKKRVLIYESWYKGHIPEFINHLIAYLNKNVTINHYVFLLHPKLKSFIINDLSPNIEIHYIPENQTIENSKFKYSESYFGFYDWKYVKHFLANNKEIDEIIFMRVESYLLLLATTFPKHIAAKGIFFQPHYRLPKQSFLTREYWKKVWKIMLLKTLNWSKKAVTLYVLNDKKATDFLSVQFNNIDFQFICDPINATLETNQTNHFSLRKTYNIEQNRKIFLVFGMIIKRKNIENILSAIAKLNNDKSSKTCLLIIGKCEPEYKEQLDAKIQNTFLLNPNLKIIMDNRYYPNETISSIFQQIDVCLIPYIDFYYSSGVMGKAAWANKPVIVSKETLSSAIVEEYQLGIAINPIDIDSILNGIGVFLEEDILLKSKGTAFLEQSNPYFFMEKLLS